MVLACDQCGVLVDATVLKVYGTRDEESGDDFRYSFAKCPKCSRPFIALQSDYGDEPGDPVRVFPPEVGDGHRFPSPLTRSLREADACFRAKAYSATALMCRKTLEGLCAEHGIERGNLAQKLTALRDNEVIDKRLYEWADALRLSGNEAAHDLDVQLKAEDARDLLEFTKAILEYIYTFRDKFAAFQERKTKRENGQGQPQKSAEPVS